MIYIGIDPSITNTGVVLLYKNFQEFYKIEWKKIKHGGLFMIKDANDDYIIRQIDAPKTKGENMRIRGLLLAFREIWNSMRRLRITPGAMCCIGIERPMGANLGAGQLVAMAYTTTLISLNDCPFTYGAEYYTPPELKKFATGKGNAKKELILQQVYKKWGVEFDDHNLADAFVLAKMAEADYNKTNNP